MPEPLLCLLARCAVPGRHREHCADEQCRGCQPARARDGGRLCELHTLRIGQDAARLAELYDELALRLLGGSGHGEPVSGTPDDTRVPNPAAVEVRTDIRHTLVAWCRLIAEERGWSLPADEMADLARYVARSAEWLAATEYADEVADELHDLVRRARQVAYPSGARVIEVAPCPATKTWPADHTWTASSPMVCTRCGVSVHAAANAECVPYVVTCPGTVRAVLRRTDSLLPSELACDADDGHRWGASQWHAFGRAVKGRAA